MKSFIIAGCIVPGDKSSKIAFSWQETFFSFYRDSILFFVHFFRDGLPFSESFLQRRYILFGSSVNLRDVISVCSFWQRRVQKSFFCRDFWICCFFLVTSCSMGDKKRSHTPNFTKSSSHRYLQRGSYWRAAKDRRRMHRCSKKERKRYHPCFEGERRTRVYRCY